MGYLNSRSYSAKKGSNSSSGKEGSQEHRKKCLWVQKENKQDCIPVLDFIAISAFHLMACQCKMYKKRWPQVPSSLDISIQLLFLAHSLSGSMNFALLSAQELSFNKRDRRSPIHPCSICSWLGHSPKRGNASLDTFRTYVSHLLGKCSNKETIM